MQILSNTTPSKPIPVGKDVLQSSISTWWDGYGFAIEIDRAFYAALKRFDQAPIGAAIALLQIPCRRFGVLCAWTQGAVLDLWWNHIWTKLDRQYFADSFIIHFPRNWMGWVYFQIFKDEAPWSAEWSRGFWI